MIDNKELFEETPGSMETQQAIKNMTDLLN